MATLGGVARGTMASEAPSGFVIAECAGLEVRSWAIHFPKKCRGDRITSVPGKDKQLAEDILSFLRSLPEAGTMSKDQLRKRCLERKMQLRDGQAQLGFQDLLCWKPASHKFLSPTPRKGIITWKLGGIAQCSCNSTSAGPSGSKLRGFRT